MSGDEERGPADQRGLTEQRRLTEQRGLADWLPARLAAVAPSVTVIGDVMLDGWWSGSIDRLCREAPAPVVDITRRMFAPGGAANTAMNLAALGAKVRVAGLVGCDDAGMELRRQLRAAGVNTSHLHEHPDMVTTSKIRISSAGQVLLRFDDVTGKVPSDALAALALSLPAAVRGQDAVVVCDYGTGALQGPVRSALLEMLSSRDASQLAVVDAHDPRPWAGMRPDLATPNAAEAARLLGIQLTSGSDRPAVMAARRDELIDATGARAVVVTLDRDGTLLLPGTGDSHRTWARPATEKQASGAGDTFVAALTLARAATLPLSTSVDLAQAAADVVVHHPGTSVCSTADLTRHLASFADTALSADELARHIQADRAEGRRIVLTNGCFDVLHRGHTRYLNQAKQLGDILVVALNSDASVRRLKGPDRPINSVADRAGVIAALSCVDYVTVFDTPTPIPLIEKLRPEIYAKGGDYTPEMLAETEAVERFGGTVTILDYVPDLSTTAVVQRIRNGEGAEVGEAPVN
ncbi:D-glycero-beta-D-manno-heptose 1-phosphate adenylyltransferase [Arthrobacter oryzae]|uniref:D-glycero-beta-D-manno-heptose 1-phosphate adenylyltransferase n=1 Tax=Arthrobacter oryzae TaxID=409290 RepID=UPI00285C46F5|nr:D-glycero-beta-D-manno-heptose 1-phosphate adenylyltransferase [Arthrobacter oryzae]MDR6504958.1 rfaE bifunctional protein kinase chain/domain/rfaE bifunctional protein nucleotidyltransferase chain/domain [Arthrobacter oryzae]